MTAMIDLRKLIEDVLVPGIQEIRLKVGSIESELKRLDAKIDNQGIQLNTKIDQLNAKIDSFQGEFRSEIRRLDQRITSQGERFDSLEKQIQLNREDFKLAISIHERLAAVEARIAAH